MRKLTKQTKPTILVDNEGEWTRILIDYIQRNEDVPKSIVEKYRHPEIKKQLLLETCYKCAYCESKILHIDYGDIEHIEPKSKVYEKTFLWDNLTISCSKCNQNKSHYYDPALPLLNPYTDDPETKIFFLGPFPFPVGGDLRTNFTIKLLKLDRAELIERRVEHINRLRPLLQQYQVTENPILRSLLWEDIQEAMKADKEFSLLTKQQISSLFPIAV